ncbi:hypothetical protein E1I69_09450 [Bacillus timonensis]|uniref:HNH nuclease domain-containing protein n=1 Tax=Bacillus timonensis TaxID=1033734 RepID=A0A4S3PUK0_9BACI|nr:HNH endonuclease [Bacillus timonensis]THE13085.1 hypothetical protein E1I69_09450 [Bacillus timonensis]
MKNDYEIVGDVTKIFVKDSNGITHEALIDTEDLELVKWIGGNWRVQKNAAGSFYVTGNLYDRNIFLHRLVTNSLNVFNKEVVHINHNTLDNRKSELRLVTKEENQQNRRIGTNNKSGVLGVHYENKSKMWIAKIGVNRKKKYLGKFVKREDAVRARKEAEEKYHTYKQGLLKNRID